MTRHALYFSVSGQRGTGRSSLYQELEARAAKVMPNRKLVFIGNPFGDLPHPLQWAPEERHLDPTTRLFNLWAPLNEFCLKELVPALNDGMIPVTDGFGLDAVLYAVAGVNEDGYQATVKLHHELVQARLRGQGLTPPTYVLLTASIDHVVAAATQVEGRFPAFDADPARLYAMSEDRSIRDYFEPETRQHDPIRIEVDGMSMENIVFDAFEAIERTIRRMYVMGGEPAPEPALAMHR